jgi:hypothetical protein
LRYTCGPQDTAGAMGVGFRIDDGGGVFDWLQNVGETI